MPKLYTEHFTINCPSFQELEYWISLLSKKSRDHNHEIELKQTNNLYQVVVTGPGTTEELVGYLDSVPSKLFNTDHNPIQLFQ